jgi:hypothetical protein
MIFWGSWFWRWKMYLGESANLLARLGKVFRLFAANPGQLRAQTHFDFTAKLLALHDGFYSQFGVAHKIK